MLHVKRDNLTGTVDDISLHPSSSEPRPLRVLFVTPRYFPHMGGIENHVYQVARRLAYAGAEVTVLATDPGGKLPTNERPSRCQRTAFVRSWPAKRDYYFASTGISSVIAPGRLGYRSLPILSYTCCSNGHVFRFTNEDPIRSHIPRWRTLSRLRNALRGLQIGMLRPLIARAERFGRYSEVRNRVLRRTVASSRK